MSPRSVGGERAPLPRMRPSPRPEPLWGVCLCHLRAGSPLGGGGGLPWSLHSPASSLPSLSLFEHVSGACACAGLHCILVAQGLRWPVSPMPERSAAHPPRNSEIPPPPLRRVGHTLRTHLDAAPQGMHFSWNFTPSRMRFATPNPPKGWRRCFGEMSCPPKK